MPDMNRFDKAAAARGAKKIDRTESWGHAQTKKALSPADMGHNRFGKPNLPAERKLAPATATTPAIVINGRKYTDPKLLEAKAAMEQSKVDDARAAQMQSRVTALSHDPASLRALVEGWMAVRKQFYPTPFNIENLSRALTSVMLQGDEPLSVALLDEVFEFLSANNYLEPAIRRRGQPSARLYPEYVTAAVTPAGAPRPTVTPVTLPEGQDARTMPFEELKRLVRSGYKPEARQ